MKKHIVISILSLALASSLNASQKGGGEHCFRPAFQKTLKRVNSVKGGSFRSLSLKKMVSKKEIFIDWRKLYWGKLSDLIYSEEEACTDDVQEIAGTEGLNIPSFDTEDALAFARELRQELKSFARQYNLKIVWRKKALDLIDGTAAFLEYWDKGYSQGDPGRGLPFAELCALSIKHTSAKDNSTVLIATRGTREEITNTKGASTQHLIKDASFLNPFLKKGA